ncbi:MAG: hypothetical protein WCA82_10210 [Jiangellales bacterium]
MLITTWTVVVRGTMVGVSETRYPTQASTSPVAETAGLVRHGIGGCAGTPVAAVDVAVPPVG